MLELAATRFPFFEEERGDRFRFFIGDFEFTGLTGIDDGLIKRNQIEVGQAAVQLQGLDLFLCYLDLFRGLVRSRACDSRKASRSLRY